MKNNDFAAFKKFMLKIPKGKVDASHAASNKIASELSCVWSSFDAADDGGLSPEKLHGRMEEIEWNPPILTFKIERHGGTAKGSVYAELQNWVVNIEEHTVKWTDGGQRIVGERKPRLDVGPLVAEVAKLIAKGSKDDRLIWKQNGQQVQIRIGGVIPGDGIAKATLTGRRNRFSKRLEEILDESGWRKVSGPHHTYEKKKELA